MARSPALVDARSMSGCALSGRRHVSVFGHGNGADKQTWKNQGPFATWVAANELPRSVVQTFCLPYRRLAACKVREGTLRWHKKLPCEWSDSVPETGTLQDLRREPAPAGIAPAGQSENSGCGGGSPRAFGSAPGPSPGAPGSAFRIPPAGRTRCSSDRAPYATDNAVGGRWPDSRIHQRWHWRGWRQDGTPAEHLVGIGRPNEPGSTRVSDLVNRVRLFSA
jgi:hypothetical protein